MILDVYGKAGFKMVGDYEMQEGVFTRQQMHLMVKQLPKRI